MRIGFHRWSTLYAFDRDGVTWCVVECVFCHTIAAARAGSSPRRVSACDGPRPKPERIRWSVRRPEPLSRYFWLLRGAR